ncbi:SAM-dependent methyltransferase, partial [Microbispora rosea]
GGRGDDLPALKAAVEARDPIALGLLSEVGGQIGRVLAALSNAIGPRVIVVGGAVAGWWNSVDPGKADWLAANQVRLAESCPGYIGPVLPGWSMPPIAAAMSDAGLAVADTWVDWTRSVRLEDFLVDLRSHSYMARMEGDVVAELLARERAELGRVFPDGRLTVPMRVYLAVGRRG